MASSRRAQTRVLSANEGLKAASLEIHEERGDDFPEDDHILKACMGFFISCPIYYSLNVILALRISTYIPFWIEKG